MSELNLRRLAEATGVPEAAFTEWAQTPEVDGIDPRLWADALAHRATHATPWPERVLDRCTRYAGDHIEATPAVRTAHEPTSQAA
ncbi:hypothetical protein [Nocardiopsis synnemataformans]|uniref:hypothetical protein n=1 Tax=Nocardiopsis synnemataformans TaxID=61305 RepID=UPI003EB833B2